jgi:hypothetical protein
MPDKIYLCVMSDDLGMHPAVNDGIAKAFCDGLLTDANIMAPCPAFREGAALARQIGLPVGFHATLTCDWDLYRWGPLTHAPSLVGAEGYLKPHSHLAWDGAKDEEALAELTAQIEAIEAEGFKSTHSSFHMGYDREGHRLFDTLAQIGMERVGPLRLIWEDNPLLYQFPDSKAQAMAIKHYNWESAFFTSDWPLDLAERREMLKARIQAMQPGYHLWMVHAALDHPALDTLCSRGYHAWNWARPYRAADMALLVDPEIKDLIAERGIRRIPVSEAPAA